MGSSVGVSRARSEQEFGASCELAFRYDHKLLVELGLNGAREIECSVLEESAGQIRASELGEIVPASKHGFYSYQAKYIDADVPLYVFCRTPPEARPTVFRSLPLRCFVCSAAKAWPESTSSQRRRIFVNEVKHAARIHLDQHVSQALGKPADCPKRI